MIDGLWDTEAHRMLPVRSPFTVAAQRAVSQCDRFYSQFDELRVACSGCLDRVLSEDY